MLFQGFSCIHYIRGILKILAIAKIIANIISIVVWFTRESFFADSRKMPNGPSTKLTLTIYFSDNVNVISHKMKNEEVNFKFLKSDYA